MTNSDGLVEVVVRAMREAINDSPRLAALHDVGEEYHGEQKKMLYVDGALDLKSIARAAIEAYEQARADTILSLKSEIEALREAGELGLEYAIEAANARRQKDAVFDNAMRDIQRIEAALSGSPEG